MTDITGLCKIELLEALWENQKVAAFFGRGSGPAFDHDSSSEAISGYIDYFYGRAIKANLSGDTVNFLQYDRDSKISGAEVVKRLRENGPIKATKPEGVTIDRTGMEDELKISII